MSALPRDPDRFATKDDLVVLEGSLCDEIRAGKAQVIRTLMFGIVASNATLVGLVVAIVKFA